MSLEKYKRDKITEALLDKGYSRYPEEYHFGFLWERFMDEVREITDDTHTRLSYENMLLYFEDDLILIENEQQYMNHLVYINSGCWEQIKREFADISNFIDFMFDRVLILEKKYRELKE